MNIFITLLNGLLKLKDHTGKLLMIPLVGTSGTWALSVLMAYLDDGRIDDQEFHNLLQGASTVESFVLVLVMALLKIKK